MSESISCDLAASLREECFIQLGMARHYADLAQGFLQIGDDAGAVYAFQRFLENARAAARDMKTVRTIMMGAWELRVAAE